MDDYRIVKAQWPEQAELLRQLRETVFVIEQRVDPDIEWDGTDHECTHALAIASDGAAIGTGRLEPNGKLGRIAVLLSHRGEGIGKAIVNQLIDYAREAGHDMVYLNSQTHARGFYEQFGFQVDGHVYMVAGIPHQRMTLQLTQDETHD